MDIGKALGWDGVTYDELKVANFKRHVLDRIAMIDHDLHGEAPYADPLNMFVKDEPHKKAKLDEGRLRLISGVGLVDTMVDRILFGWLMQRAMTTVTKTPCRVGWNPADSGWREMAQRFKNKPIVCLDKSAWDWTVQSWLVEALHGFIDELAIEPAEWWRFAVANRMRALFETSVFKFKDGTMVRQVGKGIMKSGCYLTLLLNSVSQVMLHVAVSLQHGQDPTLQLPQAMGDDTIQESPRDLETYVKDVEALGCRIKGAKVRADIEFAGFHISESRVLPAYPLKHLYKLQYSEDVPGYLRAMQLLYAFSPSMYAKYNKTAVRHYPQAVLPLSSAMQIWG